MQADPNVRLGVEGINKNWDERINKAVAAWDGQISAEERRNEEGSKQDIHPRKQFEANLLSAAQGLWGMLHSKPGICLVNI